MSTKNVPPYTAHFDGNQVPSLMGVEGTLGTSDAGGTARTVPIGANPATGALYVQDLAGASGTTNVQVVGGTLGSVLGIGGTVQVSGASAGTYVNIVTGSQQTLGTVGTVPGIGTITNIGSISNIGTMPAVGGGTQFSEDTQHISGDGGNLLLAVRNDGGTTLAGSDLDYTVLSTDANGALRIGGTVATGAGTQAVRLIDGTLTTLQGTSTVRLDTGTVTTGSLTNLANLINGSINILTGTLQSSGTTTGVGTITNVGSLTNIGTIPNIPGGTLALVTTLSNLTNGSINILTGTVTSVTNLAAGTITALASGTITTGTVSVTTGTIVGPVASGGSETGAPVPIGGTDSGGTVRLPLVNSSGFFTVNVNTGTLNVGTANVSLVSSNGTIVRTGNLGTLELGSVVVTSMPSSGTIVRIGNVGTLELGSVVVTSLPSSGTIVRVGNVGTLESGSVILKANNGVDIGNVDVPTGSIQINKIPIQIGTSYGTLGTAGAATWGTLIAASGAGTYQYISGLSIIVASGTVDCAITTIGVDGTTGAGVLARGNLPAGGGIVRDFDPVMRSGTNGTIGFWLGGAGTAFFSINYWQTT